MRIENHTVTFTSAKICVIFNAECIQTLSFIHSMRENGENGTKEIYIRVLHLTLITLVPLCPACNINYYYHTRLILEFYLKL